MIDEHPISEWPAAYRHALVQRELLQPLGVLEVVRTGPIAMGRGRG